MNESPIISILKKQIYLGKSRTSVAALLWIAVSIFAIMGLNLIYIRRYNKLLTYFRKFHPEVYERVRRKPDIGPFYSTGYNHSKPLIELASQPGTLNDSKAQKMLSEFLEFDRKTTWIGSIMIVIILLIFIVLSIISL